MIEQGVFRRRDRVFRPWKNGGGETAEVTVSPPGADFESFDWRISTAIVAGSGPFSAFPGIYRVLAVIEGGAMVLDIGGCAHRLDAGSDPVAFPGDVRVNARLGGKALLDFNVMVRRPLAATVTRGPLAPTDRRGAGRARLALLLEPRAGLARLDLVDLSAAAPSLTAALAGARALDVRITG